jgi:DNA (cytosine-5)-methyltransferase 1
MEAIDLFSGIGGLGLGFTQAGFKIKLAVELSTRRLEVYRRNVKPSMVINGDVRKINFSEYKDADAVIAGPPCQPYSSATPKNSKGINHPYYGLDEEVLRAVKQIKPKIIAVEEVPAWNPTRLIKGLSNMGYSTHAKVYDMSLYGIPMKRRRWIVIALMNGRASELSIPTAKPPKPIELLRDLPTDPCTVDPCSFNGRLVFNHVNASINSNLKELIPKIPPGYSLVTAYKAGLIMDVSKYVKDIEKKHSYWLYRVPINEPVKVVPHPRRSMMLHPTYNRMITVRELARLYTYPDWFNLKPLSIDEMYRAITDSVPPLFAQRLAEAILKRHKT